MSRIERCMENSSEGMTAAVAASRQIPEMRQAQADLADGGLMSGVRGQQECNLPLANVYVAAVGRPP